MVVQLMSRWVGGRIPPTSPAPRVIAPWLYAAPVGVPKGSDEEEHLRLLRIANEQAEEDSGAA